MRPASVTQRAMAVSLALILISCGTTRSSTSGPTGPENLARYALIIKPQADGQVTHEWVPLKDFDMAKLQLAMHPITINRDIVRVSTSDSELEEYCEGRRLQCEQDCLRSSRPFLVDWRKYN